MPDCSFLGWATFVVLTATGAVVAWYSWETHLLRLATHRQSSLLIRPFLAIRYDEKDRRIWIHNIGRGVARNIRVHDVHLSRAPDPEGNLLIVEWQPIDFLPEGQERELVGKGQWITRDQKQEISRTLRSWISNFGPHGKTDYEFVLDYQDLAGTAYRAAFGVSKGQTTLLRDEIFTE